MSGCQRARCDAGFSLGQIGPKLGANIWAKSLLGKEFWSKVWGKEFYHPKCFTNSLCGVAKNDTDCSTRWRGSAGCQPRQQRRTATLPAVPLNRPSPPAGLGISPELSRCLSRVVEAATAAARRFWPERPPSHGGPTGTGAQRAVCASTGIRRSDGPTDDLVSGGGRGERRRSCGAVFT